jgi:integrase
MKEKVMASLRRYPPEYGQLSFCKSLRGIPDYAVWIPNSKLGIAADLQAHPRFRRNHSAYSKIRHSRHTYRSWLDQVGTQSAVQQKAMRHTDIRTTMIYGDVVDGRIGQALEKVSGLVFANSTQAASGNA